MAREQKSNADFVSILGSDATFRLVVPEGTEGAEVREYETPDGVKGSKNEIVFKALSGKITKVAFADTTFGRLLQVTINDENGDLIISTPVGNNFATDLMKKLPSMDFSKVYRLAPYSIEKDGKTNRGISIIEGTKQDKEAPRVENFFYDKTAKKELHGFPAPKGDIEKFTKNKWKAYFGEVEDFLIEYTEQNLINKQAEKTGIEAFEDIDPEKEAEELMGKK